MLSIFMLVGLVAWVVVVPALVMSAGVLAARRRVAVGEGEGDRIAEVVPLPPRRGVRVDKPLRARAGH
jgi:hypothetical protein